MIFFLFLHAYKQFIHTCIFLKKINRLKSPKYIKLYQ